MSTALASEYGSESYVGPVAGAQPLQMPIAASSLHCHRGRQSSLAAATNTIATKSARSRLLAASGLCLLFMLIELVGGVMANSLAIATDAAHLLTDFASFMISLFAIWMGSRPATKRMSFGWYRAEVIGALTSVLMIWVVTGILVCIAVQRMIRKEYEIEANIMLISASIGLVVNIAMGLALHIHPPHVGGHCTSSDRSEYSDATSHLAGPRPSAAPGAAPNATNPLHTSASQPIFSKTDEVNGRFRLSHVRRLRSHHHVGNCDESCNEFATSQPMSLSYDTNNAISDDENQLRSSSAGSFQQNINVKAAFIHVLGDFIQSVGVLLAALVIYKWPEYAIVDPLCTLLFSVIVLITTVAIIREALNVLMEGLPHGIDFHEVQRILNAVPGVERIHDLHIWSLSMDKVAVSAHIVISRNADPIAVRRLASKTIHRHFDVFKLTLQVEAYEEGIRHNCAQCQLLP